MPVKVAAPRPWPTKITTRPVRVRAPARLTVEWGGVEGPALAPLFFSFPRSPVGMPSSTLRVGPARHECGRRASRTAFPRRAWERVMIIGHGSTMEPPRAAAQLFGRSRCFTLRSWRSPSALPRLGPPVRNEAKRTQPSEREHPRHETPPLFADRGCRCECVRVPRRAPSRAGNGPDAAEREIEHRRDRAAKSNRFTRAECRLAVATGLALRSGAALASGSTSIVPAISDSPKWPLISFNWMRSRPFRPTFVVS